jgi:hypothetical protein
VMLTRTSTARVAVHLIEMRFDERQIAEIPRSPSA